MSEYQEKEQNIKSSPSFTKSAKFNLKDAINLGEYNPDIYKTFPNCMIYHPIFNGSL